MARVLVVDDYRDWRELVITTLTAEGHECMGADTGAYALSIFATRPPDLALIDLVMPDRDGIDVVKTVRARRLAPDARMVLTVCHPGECDAESAASLGVDAFLAKPVPPGELPGIVARLLAGSARDAVPGRIVWTRPAAPTNVSVLLPA